ncbi:MAG: acyl carrier protein [Candidatus Omnitrophota bacterium]
MISKTQLSKELKTIVSDVSCVAGSSIQNSTDLEKDLGIDSFNAAEILVAVEQKYKVTIDPAEVFSLRYFRQVVELVDAYVNK